MRRGIILKRRLGIKGKNRERCKEQERRNGRRGGTKAITPLQHSRTSPGLWLRWFVPRSCQRGEQRDLLPKEEPLSPTSSSFSIHCHSLFFSSFSQFLWDLDKPIRYQPKVKKLCHMSLLQHWPCPFHVALTTWNTLSQSGFFLHVGEQT